VSFLVGQMPDQENFFAVQNSAALLYRRESVTRFRSISFYLLSDLVI